mgnify:CR=1 FL=1
MNNILVPTDFSPEAYDALKVAVDISKTVDGQIVLLNVIDAPGGNNFSSQGGSAGNTSLDDIFTAKLIEKMRNDLDDMLEGFESDNISKEMALGDVRDKINERVVLDNIDLVVMGTKGADGMQEVMVGSNAEKIVRKSHCPVLTLKQGSLDVDPKNIVFASDFTENYDNIAPKLKDFQKHYDAKLHLLFVNTPNKFEMSSETRRRIMAFVSKYGIENYTINIYNHRDEEDGILNFAEEFEMDLIAVATHSRKGLAHLLSGSIAEGVVNHSKKPVLSYSLKHIK